MRMRLAYEVADLRNVDQERKLGSVGVLVQYPGGLELRTENHGLALDLVQDINDSMITDDEGNGTVTLALDNGVVVLTSLDRDNFAKRVLPFVGDVPEQQMSRAELNAYYYRRIRDLE